VQRRSKQWVWIGVGAGVGLLLLVGSALATDRAEFCPTCHEMQPYYDSWVAGSHKGSATCIDCHVEPGLPARLAHKPVALGEVWAHFFGNTKFPLATPPEVPSGRCIRCHDELPGTVNGFPHAEHTREGGCAACHFDAGHVVTSAQLKAADAFAPGVKPARLTGDVATVDGGTANLPGHPATSCERCHDMRRTRCSACHTPPHEARGNCSACHTAAAAFAFRHPGDLGEHSFRSFACVKCHPRDFTHASCTCHGGRPPEEDDD